MFVNYEEYQNNGGTLTQTLFNKFEPRAEGYVQVQTGGKDLSQFEELVKKAICEITDVYYQKSLLQEKLVDIQNSNISNEKVGSYSVSYTVLDTTEINNKITHFDKEMNNILFEYLYTTGLLYRGMPNVRY